MQNYEENVEHDNLRRPGFMLFLRAMRAAFLRPKLWGATWLVLLLLSLVLAMQTHGAVSQMVGNRYASSDAARDLDPSLSSPTEGLSEMFRQDHRGALSALDSSISQGSSVLALIVLLFGVFAAGGWLQVTFEQPDRQTLRRFGFGGARYFGRFLRVAILMLLALSFVHWIYFGDPWQRLVYGAILDVPKSDWKTLETLDFETEVVRLAWIQEGLFTLAFAKVLAFGIYTRTRLALRDSRSVLGAAIATAFTMMRHPIQTMRPLALLLLVEAAMVIGFFGWWMKTINGRFENDPNGWHVLAMFGVGQLAIIFRQVTRGAYYHAAGRVSQALILPTERRPDPWAQTIGGPGGPQYPVSDDGYHVTV